MQDCKNHNFRFPIWLRQALAVLAHNYFSRSGLVACSATLLSHIRQPSSLAMRSGAWPQLHAGLRIGLDAIVNATALEHSTGEANSNWRKTTFKFCVFGYPFSDPVAPPGTAWGAEGLRGNVANENNLMVLVPAKARKGQSGRRFAQEVMTVRLRASGFGEAGVRVQGLGVRKSVRRCQP